MSRKLCILLIGVLCVSVANAHRLNEYLQATTVSIGADTIKLHMRLTPGTDIAPKVLALVDTDHDGVLSAAEQKAYAGHIIRSLSLQLDLEELTIQVNNFIFSTTTELKDGTGQIELFLYAPVSISAAAHRLVFENRDSKSFAVYLVNCLQPAGNSIAIADQSRNADQSVYILNFTADERVHTCNRPDLENDDYWAVVKTYFVHGVKHILFGFDHLLFLCALVLGAATLWDLIKIVTAFTIAHSLTLTLAVFNLVHLPVTVTELFISLSIVVVALQNIYWPQSSQGKQRFLVAFVFGLFHGLGFAGGLLTLMHNMPPITTWLAIAGFTIGIEAGNQLVLLPFFAALSSARLNIKNIARRNTVMNRVQKTGSVLIAVAGFYYVAMALLG